MELTAPSAAPIASAPPSFPVGSAGVPSADASEALEPDEPVASTSARAAPPDASAAFPVIPGLPPEVAKLLSQNPQLLQQLASVLPPGMLPPGVLPKAPGAPPRPPGPAAPGQRLVELPAPVVFATGRADLLPESDPLLTIGLAALRARPAVTLLRIEVHTDAQGSAAFNEKLSAERALSVARWFVAHGTDCRRVLPAGFGETHPIADNATPSGRAQNRRTELHIAALNGKPVNGQPVDGGGLVAGDPCKP